jgi:redox-sensitive bicupin YhaK (pirin superfamily)
LNFATDTPLCTISDDIIADFDDFLVNRIKLSPGESFIVEEQRYCIVMPIIGEVTLANTLVATGSAFYLPKSSERVISNDGSTDSLVLLAMPQEGSRL